MYISLLFTYFSPTLNFSCQSFTVFGNFCQTHILPFARKSIFKQRKNNSSEVIVYSAKCLRANTVYSWRAIVNPVSINVNINIFQKRWWQWGQGWTGEKLLFLLLMFSKNKPVCKKKPKSNLTCDPKLVLYSGKCYQNPSFTAFRHNLDWKKKL